MGGESVTTLPPWPPYLSIMSISFNLLKKLHVQNSMLLSYIVQILDGCVGEFELNSIRFLCMFLILFPALLRQRLTMRIQQKYILPTMLLSFAYFALNGLSYGSTTYIPAGTAYTVSSISLLLITLFATVLASIYKERKVHVRTTLCDSASVILLSVAILLVIQPEELFGPKPKYTYESYCNPYRFGNSSLHPKLTSNFSRPGMENETADIYGKEDGMLFVGYIYASCSGLAAALIILLGKCIFKEESIPVVLTWLSLGDTVISLVCTSVFETFVFPTDLLCAFVVIAHGFLFAFMALSSLCFLNDVPSVDFSLIYTFAVAFMFVFQFTFLKNASPSGTIVNLTAVLGAACVSITTILKPLCECIIIYRSDKAKFGVVPN